MASRTEMNELTALADDIVDEILRQSAIPGPKRRAEVEDELRTHIEEIVMEECDAGHDEVTLRQIVQDRLGNSIVIAQHFSRVYRNERAFWWSTRSFALLLVCLSGVASTICAIQLLTALRTGVSLPFAFRNIRWEIVGFGAVTTGYLSFYFGEMLFCSRAAKASLFSAVLALVIAISLYFAAPGHAMTPVLAYLSDPTPEN